MDTTQTTEVYQCTACGEFILHALPAGLVGKFFHYRCRPDEDAGYGVLDDDTIEDTSL